MFRNQELGELVFYFRRGKANGGAGSKGLARAIAAEPPISGDASAVSCVWLPRGRILICAAPEHLHVVAALETTV